MLSSPAGLAQKLHTVRPINSVMIATHSIISPAPLIPPVASVAPGRKRGLPDVKS